MYYQSDFLTTLAYLMGERTVNSTTSGPRADFVQESLNEAYRAYPWRFARSNATLVVDSGTATLPTNYDSNHILRAQFLGTEAVDLKPLNSDDDTSVQDGDRFAWIDVLEDGVTYVLKTKDSDVDSVSVRYQKQPPTLDSAGTIGTPYPNKMTIALGSRRYVKLGQNPDADISQEQAQFDKRLANDIASAQIAEPRKKRRQVGNATGEF